MQHFKILQIVFRPKKLSKVNYEPSKMKVLKDTFQQSFKLHKYWELKKKEKCAQTHTCSHKRIYAYMHSQAYTHAHTQFLM